MEYEDRLKLQGSTYLTCEQASEPSYHNLLVYDRRAVLLTRDNESGECFCKLRDKRCERIILAARQYYLEGACQHLGTHLFKKCLETWQISI